MSTSDSPVPNPVPQEDGANLRNPKKSEEAAAKAEAIEKAKALIIRASESFASGQAEEHKVIEAEKGLAALKKKKGNHYWEAGRLLAEARALAPHGTWTRLLKESGVSVTSDHDWRLLYKHFPDPTVLEDVAISQAIEKAKEIEAGIKAEKTRAIAGPVRLPDQRDHDGEEDETQAGATLEDSDRRDDGDDDEDGFEGLRVWTEADAKGGPLVHACRVGRGGWTPICRVQWKLGLGFSAPPKGNRTDVTCPKCIGKMAVERAEAERKERERTPHGSEVGYVWELLEGDDPDAIHAKWLPITEIRGQEIVTSEKLINVAEEPVYRSKRAVLEDRRSRYEREIEQDEAEIARLRHETKEARRRICRLNALLEDCPD